MAEAQGGDGSGSRGNAMRRTTSQDTGASHRPCGACKILRRKCIEGCIFAPYFVSDHGAATFAAVHKVFGAKNISKLLMSIPENQRNDAVTTLCYEAQARISDPVNGCYSTVVTLQQKVASMQSEVDMLKNQMNEWSTYASSFQNTSINLAGMQPTYSNNLYVPNNLMNMNSFNPVEFDHSMGTTPSSHNIEAGLPQFQEEDGEIVPHGFNHIY